MHILTYEEHYHDGSEKIILGVFNTEEEAKRTAISFLTDNNIEFEIRDRSWTQNILESQTYIDIDRAEGALYIEKVLPFKEQVLYCEGLKFLMGKG